MIVPYNVDKIAISIHAPRGGSDVLVSWDNSDQSISIHAPRGGSDGMEVEHCPAN